MNTLLTRYRIIRPLSHTIKRALICFVCSCLCPPLNALDSARQYAIPAQPLNDALVQFAEQSVITLIFASDRIRGIETNALIGSYTIEQGLSALLQGSGFTYRFIDNNTVTLITDTTPVAPSNQPTLSAVKQHNPIKVLSPMLVKGKHIESSQTYINPKQPYKVTHSSGSTKTLTALKSTPQSIQVLPKTIFYDQKSLSISETIRNVSGVNINSTVITPSFDFTRIRGFKAEQMLDGFTQYYNPGDRESLVNVETIEVLKGSNALLYGGGSGTPSGGLINIISKLPHHTSEREIGIKYGSYQYYQPWLDINQPITDQVLLRVTGELTGTNSHIDTLETQRYNLNPALTLTDNEATNLTLQGKFSRWQQQDYQGLPATGTLRGNFKTDRNTFAGPFDIADSKADFFGLWGSLDHKLDEIWSLNLKARYAQSEFDQKVQLLFGADGIQADLPLLFPSTWAVFNTQLFQEQQETSISGRILADVSTGPVAHKILLGADFSRYTDQGFVESDAIPVGWVDLNSPNFPEPYTSPGTGINNVFVTNETYGAYLQWQSSWFGRLHLLGGLRLGHVGIDYRNRAPGFIADAKTDKTRLLGRMGAVVDVSKNISVFAGFSQGMRGQPFVNFVAAPQPELSRQLEAGLKFDFPSLLSGQIVVYQIDLDKVAVTDTSDPQRRSVTTGQERSQGVETDLLWHLNNNLNVLTSFAYTDAKYTANHPVFSDGTPISGIPDYSGRVWANYRFPSLLPGNVTIGAGIYAQSAASLSVSGINTLPSFYTVDAAINYRLDDVSLALSGKNLTNDRHFEYLNYFKGRVAPAQPVSLYFDISYRF